MEKKVQRNFLWIALLVLGTIWILARHNRTQPYYTINGLIFGTVYNITYQYDGDLKVEIDEELKRFDGSLSPFNDTATITRINRNEDIVPDTFFTNVFIVVWKFPKKRMVHSTLRLPHWPMPGGLVSRKAHFLIRP